MGRDPLVLTVDGWRFELEIKDHWTQISIVTDDNTPQTRYVRITPNQSQALLAYLELNLPLPA